MLRKRRNSIINERSVRQARILLESLSSSHRRSLNERRRLHRGLRMRRQLLVFLFWIILLVAAMGLFNEFS